MELIRLPPGMPFVLSNTIYYREFAHKLKNVTLVKCFAVKDGCVSFKSPSFFNANTIIQPYEFKNNKT